MKGANLKKISRKRKFNSRRKPYAPRDKRLGTTTFKRKKSSLSDIDKITVFLAFTFL